MEKKGRFGAALPHLRKYAINAINKYTPLKRLSLSHCTIIAAFSATREISDTFLKPFLFPRFALSLSLPYLSLSLSRSSPARASERRRTTTSSFIYTSESISALIIVLLLLPSAHQSSTRYLSLSSSRGIQSSLSLSLSPLSVSFLLFADRAGPRARYTGNAAARRRRMCAISGLFAREGERERETVKYSGDDARFFVYACMHACMYIYVHTGHSRGFRRESRDEMTFCRRRCLTTTTSR